MSIKDELQKERKELLLLRSDAHIEHAPFNEDHSIGTKKDCKICQIYKKIEKSDELVTNKLRMIHEDELLIGEFKQLRRRLEREPNQSEFKQANEAIERFGNWENFLTKIKNQKE